MNRFETTINTLKQLANKIFQEDYEIFRILESEDNRYTIALNKAISELSVIGQVNKTGYWEAFEFESMIPVEFDENDNVILHKYINYKCSSCRYKNGNRQTNYCPNCGIKMSRGMNDGND